MNCLGGCMSWTFKGILLAFFTLSANAGVESMTAEEIAAQTISHVEVTEVASATLTKEGQQIYGDQAGVPLKLDQAIDPVERAGRIIAIGKDLVALGESVYQLVQHGKPSNTTKYEPISVVPKVNGAPADVFDTENWRLPVKRTFVAKFVNPYRMNVIVFRYSVIYSYGGSYNGKGSYLTSTQIVPEYVSTMFGFDFTATMKLGGIQNQGSKENPVAGATLLMEYTAKSVVKAISVVDTFYVNGRGAFKKY